MSSSNAVGQPKCCEEEKGKLKKACAIDVDENKDFRKDQEKRKEARIKYNKKLKPSESKKEKEIYRIRDKTWKDKHCQKLLFDYELSADDVKKNLQTVKDEMDSLQKDFENVLLDKVGEIGVDKAEKVLAVGGCAAAGAVVGGIIGFFFGGAGAVPGAALGAELGTGICGAAATVDTVVDAVGGAAELWENKDAIKKRVGELMNAKDRVDEFMGNIDKLDKATDEERKKLKEEIYGEMADAIKDDPCIKAKRCELIPYQQGSPTASDAKANGVPTPMDKMFKLDKKSGCCPGQRAHHIIPKAKLAGCANYTDTVHNNAPTVCAEGGHSNGTHGKMHTNTDNNTEYMIFGEDKYESPHKCAKNASSTNCTIEASADAFMKTFSDSKCDKECIKKQLKEYYEKLGCEMKPVNKTGGEIKKDDENNERGRK